MSNTPQRLEGEAEIPGATKIVFGPEKAFTAINAELDEIGASRAFIVTGNTLANKTDLIPRLVKALGKRSVGVFDGMRMHTPRDAVLASAGMARKANADVLIGVGGGSPIVGTKGTALVLAEGEDMDALCTRYDHIAKTYVVPKLTHRKLPIIVIPTTLSAGEFNSSMGITNPATGGKDIFVDPGVVPHTIIFDPLMTSATPPWLWGSTGVKGLQNAVERYMSRNRSPFSEGLGLEAIKIVFRYLKKSVDDPSDMFARGNLQFLNWMTAFGGGKGGFGLGHGICHQLGGLCNVPHGVAGCIVLPHMMEYNRSVTLERQRHVAEAMGIVGVSDEEASVKATAKVRGLVQTLGLPSRLRDAGVKEADLPKVAELALRDRSLNGAPRPPKDAAEILGLLQKMY